MIIGVCGKSGSGKSTLANIIKNEYPGSIHIDIDKIGHEVLLQDDVKERLVNTFGTDILLDGNVNRKVLSTIVFSSKECMAELTSITWESMNRKIQEIIDNNQDKVIILDWLLLPRTHLFSMCDLTILLDVPFEERMRRAINRDGISEEKFRLRDEASVDYQDYVFDVVLEDTQDLDIRKLVKMYE